MSDLIDRKEVVEAIKNEMLSWLEGDSHDYRKVVDAIMDLPTVDAVPSQLTKEEIQTIRIHMNSFKENLCNLHRWRDAEEYQQIVDKLDRMMDVERKEE